MASFKRNYCIDFWKLVFSVMIVICHSAVLPAATTENVIAPTSFLGVEFFFIVSGFLMAKSIKKKTALKPVVEDWNEPFVFIIGKIKSLFPYYLFALIVSIIIRFLTEKNPNELFTVDFFSYIWDLFFLRMAGFRGESAAYAVGASWYISAMLISMFMIYPFLRIKTELFINWLAPLVSILLLGYICRKYGNLSLASTWTDDAFFADGLIRGIAEICLGIWSFGICDRLTKKTESKKQKVLLSVLEIACYVGVLIIMFEWKNDYHTFITLPLYVIAIIASFSEKTISATIFKSNFFENIGTMSLCLYLNHMNWKNLIQKLHLPMTFKEELTIYLICSFASAILCMYTIMGIKWIRSRTIKKPSDST